MENEEDNQLNRLNLTITRTPKQLCFEVYSKPTASGVLINTPEFIPPHRIENGFNRKLCKQFKAFSNFVENELRKIKHSLKTRLSSN
jgi:hypothetical protein